MRAYSMISLAALLAAPAFADTPSYTITIKDHKFSPSELTIPVDTKVKLIVKNEDKTPAEFESHDFNREKIIQGGKQGIVFVGPLKKGRYNFFEEFHPATGQGTLIVE